MTTEATKPDETKPADPAPSPTLTKAEVEQMLAAQAQQFASLLTRAVETLAPAKPAGGNEGEKGKVIDFYNEPAKAAEALLEAKMAPVREAYVANEKQRQLAEVAALPHAGEYIGEIQKVIESAPPLAQIQPGFAKEAYNLVIGRHFDDVRKKAAEKEAIKPEFTETISAGAPVGKKSEKLTSEESRAAEGMGLTDDEYRKWRDNPAAMAAEALKKKAS